MSATRLSINQLSWVVQRKAVLKDISFEVHPGEKVGIIGPNGAGKSSLLSAIRHRVHPSGGEIRLNGTPVSQLSARAIAQRVAVVSQQSEAVFSLRVRDVVAMGLVPHQPWYKPLCDLTRKRVSLALEQMGLTELAESPFEQLSGGEQQRALIARALVQQADFLLMDEPTNHLDVHYQHEILQRVTNMDVTLLIAVHDLNLAAQYCDRLMLLNKGQLIADGAPEDVLTPSRISEVFNMRCHLDRHPLIDQPRVSFALKETANAV